MPKTIPIKLLEIYALQAPSTIQVTAMLGMTSVPLVKSLSSECNNQVQCTTAHHLGINSQ